MSTGSAGLLCLMALAAHGQSVDTVLPERKTRLKLEAGSSYLAPTQAHRQIHTACLDLLAGAEFFPCTPLTVLGGLTVNYAWGSIIQWDDNFQDVTHANHAVGIGPMFLLRFEPFVYKGFSVSPEVSGACVIHTSEFPHGGDIYNLLWRLGGSVNYRVNQRWAVSLNARWTHVSNGQGLGPHNPSYEGAGVGLTVAYRLKAKTR